MTEDEEREHYKKRHELATSLTDRDQVAKVELAEARAKRAAAQAASAESWARVATTIANMVEGAAELGLGFAEGYLSEKEKGADHG